MKIHIKNGRVVDPAQRHRRSRRRLHRRRQDRRHRQRADGFEPTASIDATGLRRRAGPGRPAARLREPGYEYKATLESEMDAAVAGGVTSLACPPDTDPPLDEPGLVEMLKPRAPRR